MVELFVVFSEDLVVLQMFGDDVLDVFVEKFVELLFRTQQVDLIDDADVRKLLKEHQLLAHHIHAMYRFMTTFSGNHSLLKFKTHEMFSCTIQCCTLELSKKVNINISLYCICIVLVLYCIVLYLYCTCICIVIVLCLYCVCIVP